MRDPCYLSSKAFNVCFLSLEDILRNEQREGTVLDTDALDLRIEESLDLLPYEV